MLCVRTHAAHACRDAETPDRLCRIEKVFLKYFMHETGAIFVTESWAIGFATLSQGDIVCSMLRRARLSRLTIDRATHI
jgi:hypothetical protein